MAGSKKSNGGKLTTSEVGASQHGLFLIDDETLTDPIVKDKVFCPVVDGRPKGHGLVPRDYRIYPPQMFSAPPADMPLIPEDEYDARIEAQERDKSSLEHIETWDPLDQNGQGYCWFYSSTGAVMAARALMHLPHVRLSAHAGAWKIKGGRDEGGWCGLSAKFYRETGCPSVAKWPEQSMARSHDTPEVWAEAARYRITEDWVDPTRDVYDVQLTMRMIYTLCLVNGPMAWDFNWWGHSVHGGRMVKVEAGSYGLRPRNSWGRWGDNGTGWATLRGQKAIPDSAIALMVPIAA